MGNVDWNSLEGKYYRVDVGSTTADALGSGDNSVIYYTTDGNVVLNGQVFGGGCLDLGLVSSDDVGNAEAAKSEVAGNRQITMIRFRVQGVTSERVTVIWQWCNGVDVCAQLKFVDKSVWRRNVTGATGVTGATTSATQWERTGAHYLGYDAANRKIQLMDYNQTAFRDVQLPLATESQAGLMSAADKTLIDEQLVRSIEFRSEEQGPGQLSLVCFNSLGEDIGSIDLPFADGVTPGILSNDSWGLFYQTYQKAARTIGYDSSTRKLYLKDVEDNTRSSVILPEATRSQAGLMSADDKQYLNEFLASCIKIYQEENPSYKGVGINFVALNGDEYDGTCIEYATSTKPGVMSAADKGKLDGMPGEFVLDLGQVSSETFGDAQAAKSEIAGNRNIFAIRYTTQGVSALKTTVIIQWCNGVNECAQIKFTDKSQWRRNITGANGVAGAPTKAFKWERTGAHYLGYDAANRKIQLMDYNQTAFKDVQLPLVTEAQAGLMSSADKAKLNMRADVREKCYGFNVKGVTNGATYNASAVPWSQADMKAWSTSSNGIFPLFFNSSSGGGNMYRPVSVEVYLESTKMVFVFDTGIVVQNWQYNAATSQWTVTVTTL